MPGHFGTVDTEDGSFASTRSSGNVGVFGNNESLNAPTGGGAGGAGVFGLTNSPGAAGVFGANNGTKGAGVQGNGPEAGLSGWSDKGCGIRAHSNHADACDAFAHDPAGNGVLAMNDATTAPPAGGAPKGNGILAVTTVPGAAGAFGANNHATKGVGVQGNGPEAGLSGWSDKGCGIRAHSNHADACDAFAHDPAGNGVLAMNDATTAPPAGGAPKGNGILAVTTVPGAAGAFGANNHATKGVGVQGNGPEAGLSGFSESGVGLRAHSNHGDGTQSFAHSSDHNGLLGLNDAKTSAPSGGAPAGNGVYGYTDVPNASGICGAVAASNTGGAGITGIGPTAGRFFGNVVVTGDICLGNADCAEDFDVADPVDATPGTVMVLDQRGEVRASQQSYDTRVAGVVSGAGKLRPGIILDRATRASNRRPLALLGKVYCKVDAGYGSIGVGDLLTTSATPGHAMKVSDRTQAFGAVIGKALEALNSGTGLIPILVGLR